MYVQLNESKFIAPKAFTWLSAYHSLSQKELIIPTFMTFRSTFLQFVLLLFPFFLFGQTAGPNASGSSSLKTSLSGQVFDGNTQKPLDYATVSLFLASKSELISGTITDEEGRFTLEAVPGNYFIKVEFLGYEPLMIEDITLAPNERKELGKVIISTEAAALDEVLVVAERSQMQLSLDKKVFNVGKDLASRGGNAAELLDNVPAVQVDVEGNVLLRGNGNVRILVNGRPSSLIGNSGTGLRNIPANLIERVEVVTNPSARYEAEGTAGIINIILKKDNRKGLNGAIDLTVGNPENYGTAITLNRRANKLNFFTNLGVNYQKSPGNGNLFQETFTPDATLISLQEHERIRTGLGGSFRFGADYFFNDRNTLTTAFNYRLDDRVNETLTTYRDFLDELSNPTAIETRTDNEDEDRKGLEYSLNYKLTFPQREGQQLTADIRYQDSDEVEDSQLLNRFFDTNFNPADRLNLRQRSKNAELEKQLIFQSDYIHPFGKDHQFEAGIRSSLRTINNDFLVEEFDENTNLWSSLEGLSNDFQYSEEIYAAYLTYGKKIGRFSYQLGLRPEYSRVITTLVETNEVNDRDYTNIFPTAHFNYDLPKQNAIQVSYSRRIQRPRFWDLNPFFSFSDNRNFRSGNPNLDPEFSHSLELSHIKYFEKGSLSSSLYYRNTTGVIQNIRVVDDLGNSITQPENLATEDAYGLDMTGSYEIASWWRFNADFNFFYFKTDASNIDASFGAENVSWFTRGTSRFTIQKKTDVQVRFNYQAPQQQAQGKRLSMSSVDIAASRDIMKDRATLTLGIRDLFNTRRWRFIFEGDNFYSEGDRRWRVRQIDLTLNYRLNQDKKRPGKERGGYEGGGDDGGF